MIMMQESCRCPVTSNDNGGAEGYVERAGEEMLCVVMLARLLAMNQYWQNAFSGDRGIVRNKVPARHAEYYYASDTCRSQNDLAFGTKYAVELP